MKRGLVFLCFAFFTSHTLGCAEEGNMPPQAVLVGPPVVTVGEWVSYDGSSSRDADGRVVDFLFKISPIFWEDGSVNMGEKFTGYCERAHAKDEVTVEYPHAIAIAHMFEEVEQYAVSLCVTDDDGDTGAVLIIVTVTDREGEQPAE